MDTTQQTPQMDDVSADLGGAFLKQSDFDTYPAIVFTIARVDKKYFEPKNGRPGEHKWVITFDGEKMFGLNKTNLSLMAKWHGKKPSAWARQSVTVYKDETISFGGRLVGGLRVRKPQPNDTPAFVAFDN